MDPYRTHYPEYVVCTLCGEQLRACGRCDRVFKHGERITSDFSCFIAMPANPFHALFIAIGLAAERKRRWRFNGRYIVFLNTPHFCEQCS